MPVSILISFALQFWAPESTKGFGVAFLGFPAQEAFRVPHFDGVPECFESSILASANIPGVR